MQGPNSVEDLRNNATCPDCGKEVSEETADFCARHGMVHVCLSCGLVFRVERHVMYYTEATDFVVDNGENNADANAATRQCPTVITRACPDCGGKMFPSWSDWQCYNCHKVLYT